MTFSFDECHASVALLRAILMASGGHDTLVICWIRALAVAEAALGDDL